MATDADHQDFTRWLLFGSPQVRELRKGALKASLDQFQRRKLSECSEEQVAALRRCLGVGSPAPTPLDHVPIANIVCRTPNGAELPLERVLTNGINLLPGKTVMESVQAAVSPMTLAVLSDG